MDYITAYNDEIQAGRIVAPKRVKKLYKQLADEIKNPQGRYIFNPAKAKRPIEFITKFAKHSKGEWAGKAVNLELWQKAYLSALFGFVDKETGLRRYRETVLLVGRKNGKSTLAAGIALYMLLGDHEPGAEVYTAATMKPQAKIIFDETRNMVSQSAQLRQLIKKRKTDLYCAATMSKMQPLGRNSDNLDGLNASCVIIDELHGVKDRNLYDVLKQSQSARRQPLLVMVTTAGTVRECIFDDIYTYACGIIDGTLTDPTFLPVLYELDNKQEWKNPAAWVKANPNLGVSKKLDDLQNKAARAKGSYKDLSAMLCKDFNIRETNSSAWLSFDDINNESTFDIGRFKNQWAIGGADLSITTDLTCATLLMMDKHTEERFIAQMYFIPADNLETRVKEDKIPYDIWQKQGLVRLCPGNTIDYSMVTAWFIEMVQEKGITPAWVYYDSYSAKYWVQEMENAGFNMVRCIQGAKTLSLPMQQLGADLKAKKVNYNNNPVLKWCLTNTAVQTDRNGNIVPVKVQNAKRRIDGTASLLDSYVGLTDHYTEFKNAL